MRSDCKCERAGSLVLSTAELIKGSYTLLKPLLPSYPKFFTVLHDVCKDCTAKEDHVLPAWRVFNPDLEFLERHVSLDSAITPKFGSQGTCTYVQP